MSRTSRWEPRARGLKNYWGYSTCGFYAPHPRYCIDATQAPREFRDCVRALHDAGIGVLLDVVFNHTSEGGASGPTINFKALANDIFYHHDSSDPRRYRDFTGCGNTVNCNHPLVTNFILHCLEYWTDRLGVDGFRFDLASVFTRGADGAPLANPPLTWGIELSRTLAKQPVIAEAWDAAGLYQVGCLPRHALGRMEWALSRCVASFRARRARTGRRSCDATRRLARHVSPAFTACTASTSSPVTTASRCTTS